MPKIENMEEAKQALMQIAEELPLGLPTYTVTLSNDFAHWLFILTPILKKTLTSYVTQSQGSQRDFRRTLHAEHWPAFQQHLQEKKLSGAGDYIPSQAEVKTWTTFILKWAVVAWPELDNIYWLAKARDRQLRRAEVQA